MLPTAAKRNSHFDKVNPIISTNNSNCLVESRKHPSAEDIKLSKDRINALRNIFPFYSKLKTKNEINDDEIHDETEENAIAIVNEGQNSEALSCSKLKEKCHDNEEEKDTCECSDNESVIDIHDSKSKSIVHSRIASYELPYKNEKLVSSPHISWKKKTEKHQDDENSTCSATDSCHYSKISKGKLSSSKDSYQNLATNFAYDGFSFETKSSNIDRKYKNILKGDNRSHVPIISSQDEQILYHLQSELDSLERIKLSQDSRNSSTSNIIIGNKDVFKLLSNKHLANLNIRVESSDHKKDNRWREGSFRACKLNIRSSFRSSKRKKKLTKRKSPTSEEKGTSDSTLKENESDSDDEVFRKMSSNVDIPMLRKEPSALVKNKFPEYAKVNKRRPIVETESTSRSLSTSPIEPAPVVKKMCSSGTRLKKDHEPSLKVNPVKKNDSFKGCRVIRRNSILYNTRAKVSKESCDQDSFVKTQAVRLRRKDSRSSKKSEYRVSVTIRPSTVANLANKFNTIILENQSGNTSVQTDVSFGKVSVVGATKQKFLRYYSSPRASFKRKYRHRPSKMSKDTKEKAKKEKESRGIDNSIYYADDLAANRRSLSNSLAELNMKDLFEDPDYNKTDEEKVCEKIKTALRSRKFKGETDDSDDDQSLKAATAEEESTDALERNDKKLLCTEHIIDDFEKNLTPEEGHFKTDSKELKISAEYSSISKCDSKQSLILESIVSEDEKELFFNSSILKTDSGDKELEISDISESKDFFSIKTAKSIDSGISVGNTPALEEEEANEVLGQRTIMTVGEELKNKEENVNEITLISQDRLHKSSEDDSQSEVKNKKRKNESGIYSNLKAVVKGTVKKTKDKDIDQSGKKEKRIKSPTRDRDKWYKRNKSKERKLKDEQMNVKNEGKIYEKWAFKRRERAKSQERKGIAESVTCPSVTSNTDEDKNMDGTDSEVYQDCSISSDKDESLYGTLKFASRSRSREKRMIIKRTRAESKKLNAKASSDTIKEDIESNVKLKNKNEKQPEVEETVKVPPLISETCCENDQLYGVEKIYESPTPTKVFPPPPKTVIPSPPSTFKRFLLKNKVNSSLKKTSEVIYPVVTFSAEENTEATENIYENLYSPDLQKLKRNREKLEGQGIKPNSSFLWSESAIAPVQATTKVNNEEKSQNYQVNVPQVISVSNDRNKVISSSAVEDLGLDGANYTEIPSSSNSDTQTVAYDDVGAPGAASYDEIATPSSCGYDDIRPPSSQDLEIYKTSSEGYDPVNPPKSDSSQYDECEGGVVTAQLVVVREYLSGSPNYAYDDISMYNSSIASHSYEPVCPPDLPLELPSISVILEVPEKENQIPAEQLPDDCTEITLLESDESEYGPHQVFSYKLTRVGISNKTAQERSNLSSEIFESSSSLMNRKKTLMKIKSDNDGIQCEGRFSESCDEQKLKHVKKSSKLRSAEHLNRHGRELSDNFWEDLSESEDEDIPVVVKTRIPIIRKRRPKQRSARLKVNKRSWSQGVRDVAAINRNHHKTASSSNFVKIHQPPHKSYNGTNNDRVITYSWRQKRTDSDNEEDNGGHYEAIYEVISPADDEKVPDDVPEEELSFDDDHHSQLEEDSFDSDDSDEAYSRLRPQLEDYSSTSRDRMESFSSDVSTERCQDYLRYKYERSQSQQPNSINKIAEAANLGMKRLRRNWSLTKNEVRTGISKMKKKSNFSTTDIKSTEDILNAVNSSSIDKTKWSLKSHFRRKSTSSIIPPTMSVPSTDGGKDNATFYLTLTIASNERDAERAMSHESQSSSLVRSKSNTASISSVGTTTSCDTSVSSKGRPLSTHSSTLFRNTSSGSNSGAVFRPRTAPPAPPIDTDLDQETSKDKLAQRLNILLAAAPLAPPGKRVLRSCETSSSETSPVPIILPSMDERLSSTKTSLSLPKGRQLSSEVSNCIPLNSPHTRTSVASSHGSTEGYIHHSDIASAPPPLPARPSSISGSHSLKRLSLSHIPTISPPIMVSGTSDIDSRSYLDLTCEPPQPENESAYMSSHFADEPLYQFYTAKVERAALYQGDSSEDDYEVINDGVLIDSVITSAPCRPTAMELVTPSDGRRTLWCELPEVVNSGILSKISSQERKIQEAMFEVITSEASYLKSLEVLVSHFMNCPEISRPDPSVISNRDKIVLFSDILPVKKCSELFLADLEKRWQESYIISGITDIILKHSTLSFNVYVKYCSNQIYQDRKLRELKENNHRFTEVLARLESLPVCQSLAMHSFLMLPMQRITRLPLLIDAIFNRLEYGSAQWQDCKGALASLTKIVAECNEGARKMERMEEMLLVSHQLDFREVKAIPLISASRWLVKKGEITRLTWKEGDAKLTFGRKISKHLLYFFLFTDLLVVTKKKSEEQHMVLDYCPRNMVQVLELESADKFPGRLLDGHKNLIIMTMLQNHETKTVEMVLSCPLESDRTRWMEAVTPRISENPDERIYEEWDCPQVQVVHSYVSTQPDEVSLKISDVINVLKKTSDGWYQGERLRDGTRGWFPGNHTVEIASAHVRARNLRQRYRLLAISGSIIDELKKEKEKFEKEERKKDRRKTIKDVL